MVKQLCSNVFGGTKLYTAGTFFWNRPQVFNPLSSLSKAKCEASYIALAISYIPISPQIICRYFSGLNPKLLTRHYRYKYLHNWAVPITPPSPPMSLLGAYRVPTLKLELLAIYTTESQTLPYGYPNTIRQITHHQANNTACLCILLFIEQ